MKLFLTIIFILVHLHFVDGAEVVLTNQDNRSFEGVLKRNNNGGLNLDVESDEGSATLFFKIEDIKTLEFLDEEIAQDGLEAWKNNQIKVAADLLKPVHKNRSAFLSLFPEMEISPPSLVYAKAQIELGQFLQAAGIAANLMKVKTSYGSLESEAEDLLLLAFYRMDRIEDAQIIAERWVKTRRPQFDSALGWWILGEYYLEKQIPKKARWLALQPITFSSQFHKDYLEECYPVVIASYLMEGEDEQALRTYHEFNDRNLIWPKNQHPEILLKIERLLLAIEFSEDDEEEPLDVEEGVANKDLNLPVESVKKLTTIPEPTP